MIFHHLLTGRVIIIRRSPNSKSQIEIDYLSLLLFNRHEMITDYRKLFSTMVDFIRVVIGSHICNLMYGSETVWHLIQFFHFVLIFPSEFPFTMISYGTINKFWDIFKKYLLTGKYFFFKVIFFVFLTFYNRLNHLVSSTNN